MRTVLEVALELARRHGEPLVFDPAVREGLIERYPPIEGRSGEIRVHPEAGSFDLARNASAIFPIYPLPKPSAASLIDVGGDVPGGGAA